MSKVFWIFVSSVAVLGAWVGFGWIERGEVFRGCFDIFLGVVLFLFAVHQLAALPTKDGEAS